MTLHDRVPCPPPTYFSHTHRVSVLLQADVDLIAAEMELSKDVAERKLREHKGDVVAALNTLVAA